MPQAAAPSPTSGPRPAGEAQGRRRHLDRDPADHRRHRARASSLVVAGAQFAGQRLRRPRARPGDPRAAAWCASRTPAPSRSTPSARSVGSQLQLSAATLSAATARTSPSGDHRPRRRRRHGAPPARARPTYTYDGREGVQHRRLRCRPRQGEYQVGTLQPTATGALRPTPPWPSGHGIDLSGIGVFGILLAGVFGGGLVVLIGIIVLIVFAVRRLPPRKRANQQATPPGGGLAPGGCRRPSPRQPGCAPPAPQPPAPPPRGAPHRRPAAAARPAPSRLHPGRRRSSGAARDGPRPAPPAPATLIPRPPRPWPAAPAPSGRRHLLVTDLLPLTRDLVAIPSESHAEGPLVDWIEPSCANRSATSTWSEWATTWLRRTTGTPIRPGAPRRPHRHRPRQRQRRPPHRGRHPLRPGLHRHEGRPGRDARAGPHRDRPRRGGHLRLLRRRGGGKDIHNGLGHLFRDRPELLQADVALLGEPTDAVIEAGCQGTMRVVVTLRGARAHTARPWMGRNAIHRLGRILAAIEAVPERRPVIDGCEFREALQAVAVTGGVAANVVPDLATVTLNHRFAPGPHLGRGRGGGARHWWPPSWRRATPWSSWTWPRPAAPALDHPMLHALLARNDLPVAAKLGWTDVARFAAHGIPAANFGPGDATIAHTADERVDRAPSSAATPRWTTCSAPARDRRAAVRAGAGHAAVEARPTCRGVRPSAAPRPGARPRQQWWRMRPPWCAIASLHLSTRRRGPPERPGTPIGGSAEDRSLGAGLRLRSDPG